jgi:hypothetical protein
VLSALMIHVMNRKAAEDTVVPDFGTPVIEAPPAEGTPPATPPNEPPK